MYRHIRKLRLTCIREADAHHGRILLEDALRTARLGDDTQFIVVRRLDLGTVPSDATATEWSRTVEASYEELEASAVRCTDPRAARAPAVIFSDRQEPWVAWAERAAAGRACPEWFWRPALPSWDPTLPTEMMLRLCFRTLAHQGGLALTLRLGLRLKAKGTLPVLLRCLKASDFTELKAELELTPTTAEVSSGLHEFWLVADLRSRWLATVAVADESLDLTAGGDIGGLIPPLVQQIVVKAAIGPVPGGPKPAERHAQPPRILMAGGERMLTRAGGLFFVLPLLVRCGLPEQLADLDDTERRVLPWQILQAMLRLARIPATDPLAITLAATPATSRPLRGWLMAAHRRCRRETGLRLRDLISRPAQVAISPTHMDVFFRALDANLRIRRAALDVDPGWVPWLGRVIAFHFNRED